jgi:hypothetical protein
MNEFDVRDFFFWYGPKNMGFNLNLPSPWLEASRILSNFKLGDFSQRTELFQLCCKYREEKFSIFGLQLFFLTAREQDLKLINIYFRDATDSQLASIALRSLLSMLGVSLARKYLEIVELIGDLLLKEKVLFSLKSLLSTESHDLLIGTVSGKKLLSSIENCCQGTSMYWFHGRPFFLGDIAIKMQRHMQIAISIKPAAVLGDGIGPTVISAASGLECPVSYTTVMTNDKVKAVLDYVKAVSAMGKAMGGWKRGAKYFYGHEIV